MTTIDIPSGLSARRDRINIARIFRAVLAWLRERNEKQRQRRALAGLSDHLLRDIGIEPSGLRPERGGEPHLYDRYR